ncbi:MAG: type II secretion system protein [Candidatus Eisenbacteria bacterium]
MGLAIFGDETTFEPGRRTVRGIAAPGFTLVELMIVMVILGILAAMAIFNYAGMQTRAREASTESDIHPFQLAAEDYATRYDGIYADNASAVATVLVGMPAGSTFKNPFDESTGLGNRRVDQVTWTPTLASGTSKAGCVAYGDSVTTRYQNVGQGQEQRLLAVIRSGGN